MKKILAVFFAIVMVLSICGCGDKVEVTSEVTWTEDGGDAQPTNGDSKSNDGNNSDSGSGNTKISNPLSANLSGAEVVIYDTGNIFSTDTGTSKTGKARANVIKTIQSKLNCKFKVVETTGDKLATQMATSAASGKALCGIIVPNMYRAGYFIQGNLVTDLTRVSSMDLSKDYMNRYGVTEASTFGKGKYAICGEGDGRTFVVYFNKRILKELGYDENYIYDLVDSGNWTVSKYRELAKAAMKDLDGKSGYSENDQWGQICHDAETGVMTNILASLNAPMIKIDSNGKLAYNMTDSKILNASNILYDMIKADGTLYAFGDNDARNKAFTNGKALFNYAYVQDAESFTSMKDDYGLAPSPKVDGASNYTSALDYNCRVLMIPAGLSSKDQYNAGAVIQAFEYLYDDVIDAMAKEYTNRYFCDKKSAENFKLAVKNMTTQPQELYAHLSETIKSGTYRVFWDTLNDKTSASAAIQSTKSATENAINEVNGKIK